MSQFEDGSILFMSPSDKTIHPSKIIRNGMNTALCISPWDGNIFCSSDDDNSLVHYSPFPSCTYTTLLYRSTLLIKAIVWTENALVVATEDSQIIVLESIAPYTVLHKFQCGESEMKNIAISCTDVMASLAADGKCRLYDLKNRRELCVLPEILEKEQCFNDDMIAQMAFNQDGKMLALPGRREIEIRAEKDWKTVAFRLHGHEAPVQYLLFSKNSEHLIAADLNKNIMWWNMKSQDVVMKFSGVHLVTSMLWTNEEQVLIRDAGGKCAFLGPKVSKSSKKKDGNTLVHDAVVAPMADMSASAAPAATTPSAFIEDMADDGMDDDEDLEDEPEMEELDEMNDDFKDAFDEEEEGQDSVNAIKEHFGFDAEKNTSSGNAMDWMEESDDDDDDANEMQEASRNVSPLAVRTPLQLPIHTGYVVQENMTVLAWTPVGNIVSYTSPNVDHAVVHILFADEATRNIKFNDQLSF